MGNWIVASLLEDGQKRGHAEGAGSSSKQQTQKCVGTRLKYQKVRCGVAKRKKRERPEKKGKEKEKEKENNQLLLYLVILFLKQGTWRQKITVI